MMDSVPLNLAHFHERRAERFIRHHCYEEAFRAMQTSMLYLQDAYKMVTITKSLEVLNTIKWDFERKIRQIHIRILQHERLRHKEILPLSEVDSLFLSRQDSQGVTAKLIARSIDKTIANYDAKLSKSLQEQQKIHAQQLSKRTAVNIENLQHQKQQQRNCEKLETQLNQMKNMNELADKRCNKLLTRTLSLTAQQCDETFVAVRFYDDDDDEIPSLAPLDLPTFDYNIFTTSAPSLADLIRMEMKQQTPNN